MGDLSQADQVRAFADTNEEILVVTHFSPDGDAIGSIIAFGEMMEQLNASCLLAVDDHCPRKYGFLPGFDRIQNLRERRLAKTYNRVAVLDAGALTRIGAARDHIEAGAVMLNIDHHHTSDHYGTLNIVNVNAAATGEILYQLCRDLRLEITPPIAYGLYVGLLTDTGRFRFSNTTARALKICGDLIDHGVKPGWVTENVYYNMPLEMVQAMARALASAELHFDGLVCMLRLNNDHAIRDTEGFVDWASSVRGVALAAFLCETQPGVFKISLRSRCNVDVSVVANQMGGGGHLKAAGFKYSGDVESLQSLLLTRLKHQIDLHGLKPGEPLAAPQEVEPSYAWLMNGSGG